MKKTIVVFSLVGLLITALIIVFLYMRGLRSYTEEKSNGTEAPIDQAQNAKAEADLRNVATYLEVYRQQNLNYPSASSFSDMAQILIDEKMLDKEPEEPNDDYHYMYCSDGEEFNLIAELVEDAIFQEGNSFCQPGE